MVNVAGSKQLPPVAVASIMNVAVWLGPRPDIVQLMLVLLVCVQPGGVAPVNDAVANPEVVSVSVSTPFATDGPLLVTVTV